MEIVWIILVPYLKFNIELEVEAQISTKFE